MNISRGINWKWLVFALVVGGVLAFFPGAFFILALVFFIIGLLRRFGKEEDRAFLVGIFLVAFGIRFLLGTINELFFVQANFSPLLGPDGERYSAGAWYISNVFSGAKMDFADVEIFLSQYPASMKYVVYADFMSRYEGLYVPPLKGFHGTGWYTYGLAFLYHLIGYAPFALKWLNGILGSLLAVTVYFIGKKLFSVRAGIIGGILIAFNPFLIMWSSTSLRDPSEILLFSIVIYCLLVWLKGNKLGLVGLVGTIIVMEVLKAGMGLFLGLLLGVSIFVWLGLRYWRFARWVVAGLSVVIIVFVISTWPTPKMAFDSLLSTVVRFNIRREGGGGASNFRIFPPSIYAVYSSAGYGMNPYDVHMHLFGKKSKKLLKLEKDMGAPLPSRWGILKGVFIGLSHFAFLPFPCCLEGKRQIAAVGIQIVGYLLIPFAFLGLIRSFIDSPPLGALLLLIFIGISIPIGILDANVWTLVRHRDLLAPLFIILVAGGLSAVWSLVSKKVFRDVDDSGNFVLPAMG